jgi:nucleoside diphosphate kinase
MTALPTGRFEMALVWEGDGVIAAARLMIGTPNPWMAPPAPSAATWGSTSTAS